MHKFVHFVHFVVCCIRLVYRIVLNFCGWPLLNIRGNIFHGFVLQLVYTYVCTKLCHSFAACKFCAIALILDKCKSQAPQKFSVIRCVCTYLE